MSKICPMNKKIVLYQDCLECDEKLCKKEKHKLVIGIDQSYNNTGISICKDGILTNIRSIPLKHLKDNSSKRNHLAKVLYNLFSKVSLSSSGELLEVYIIIERIRLQSQGFINIDYIKSIGALNAIIVDQAKQFNLSVYSVDTRAWKSSIVGTSKPQKNKFGIDPEKWPTIQYVKSLGYEDKILVPVSNRKKKGVFEIDGVRYTYNDDAADSACIALYGFLPQNKQKLILEH